MRVSMGMPQWQEAARVETALRLTGIDSVGFNRWHAGSAEQGAEGPDKDSRAGSVGSMAAHPDVRDKKSQASLATSTLDLCSYTGHTCS